MRSFDSHLKSETPVALSGAFLEQVGIVPGFRGERKLVGSAWLGIWGFSTITYARYFITAPLGPAYFINDPCVTFLLPDSIFP